MEKCQERSKGCAAVVYKSDEKICYIHEASVTYSYHELDLSSGNDEGFLRKCIANSSEGMFSFYIDLSRHMTKATK